MRAVERRRGMKSGGVMPLPYDAEIEYLEGTGTQYIDTGVDLKKMMVAKYRIEFTSVSGIQVIFGVYTNSTNTSRGQLYINGVAWKDFSSNNMQSSGWAGNAAVGTVYDITSYNRNINTSDYTMYVFARNTDNNSPIPTKMRLYRMTMTQDGLLVRDFIPVRKGQIGYLYDRVSKQLFGNSGTGDFVLGQDIVEVEYLESSGTAYIDTGVYITKSTTVEISHQVTALYADVSADITYFSCWASNSQCAYCFRTGSNAIRTRWGSSTSTDLAVSKNDMILFTVDGTKYVNKNATKNTTKSANTGSSYPTNQTFRLFAGTENIPVRIYYAKVGNLDLVPVRVGTIGYMLDKVEHKLYGNAGTGSFVLGNDKNT